jgi:septal ring factor EnvC (AmiA/AmiB activator)
MEKPIDKGAAQFAADEIQRLEDRINHLEDALRRIANTDYRGNRSIESQIAFEALKDSR